MSGSDAASPRSPTRLAALSLPAGIRQRDGGVRWSVMVRDLESGAILAEASPALALRTASVGKLFILLETARRIDEGTLDPRARISPRPEERVADSGILRFMADPAIAIADAALLVGAFSDNLAANMLIGACGLAAIQALGRGLGYRDTTLLDYVRDVRTPQMPETLSRGTGEELSDLMRGIARGTAVSPTVSARVRAWLATDADLSMVAAAFDLDPLCHSEPDHGIALFHKTGTVETARIDVGCVTGPAAGVAYAAAANWEDDDLGIRHRVLAAMRELGETLRRRVAGW